MVKKREQRTGKLILIYGSLYLDEGEPWEFAEKQVDECVVNAREVYPMHRIGLAFDIVATPAQIATGEAGRLAKHLLAYADKRFPNLRARFVGVTDDDARRPGRDIALLGKLDQDAVDNKHIFVYD
ncbi:MAG: hypothetical protein JXM73_19105 [Anaerolineae bacterium]|nr:hypothetical protein [Anaerolineae bacterium]